ncbi:RidA family protein [Francisellaceae bacterium]|nr:RidA family protein [Francisellaceae bacterium]
MKKIIATKNAPSAIGTYSQAVQAGDTLYISGQIPLDPQTMEIVSEDFSAQAEQMFKNMSEVVKAAGGTMENIVKVNLYLTDLGKFALVNEAMARYFDEPYPARAAVEVSALPKGVQVEAEAIAYFP